MRELKIEKKFNTRFTAYTKEINKKKYIPMSIKEETEAFIKYTETKDPLIKDKIVNANIRFAFAVAKQYASSKDEEILLDLVQESNMGLIEAIDKFEISQGFKFISYAVWICRKNCMLYLSNNLLTVKMPIHTIQHERTLDLLSNNFFIENGYMPNHDELVKLLTEKFLHRKSNLNCDQIVDNYFKYKISIASLDQTVNSDDNEGFTLKDTIEQTDFNHINDFIKNESTSIAISQLLNKLSEKERIYIEWRYGLKDHVPNILESKFKIDLSDARSFHANIMRKLKNSTRRDKKFFNSELFV